MDIVQASTANGICQTIRIISPSNTNVWFLYKTLYARVLLRSGLHCDAQIVLRMCNNKGQQTLSELGLPVAKHCVKLTNQTDKRADTKAKSDFKFTASSTSLLQSRAGSAGP